MIRFSFNDNSDRAYPTDSMYSTGNLARRCNADSMRRSANSYTYTNAHTQAYTYTNIHAYADSNKLTRRRCLA